MNRHSASAMQPVIGVETIPLSDWSGLTDFGGSAQVYAPRNEDEVVALVRFCRDNRKKLRVAGLRTSWNALWYTTDVIMTTSGLQGITEIDAVNKTVTCLAGTTLEQLHASLWEKGMTLETAPAVDWVTVAGAVNTGSHGSGPPSMSSSMIGCRLVTASGDVLDIHHGHELLPAAQISMGTLGIMTSITLRVVDAFYVALTRTRISESDWPRYLSEGEMSYVQWFPGTGLSTLSRVDVLADKAAADRRTSNSTLHGFDVSDPGQIRNLAGNPFKAGDAVVELANCLPSLFAARNRFILELFFQDVEKAGPAYQILMSYKSSPVAGGEWSVPVEKFEAAFGELQSLVQDQGYFLPIVWLKKVKGEDAWLAAADGDCVQCGIYHSRIPGSPDHARQMVHRVERIMASCGGRPHLGKLISLDPASMRRLYPNWDRFNALRKQMDPQGMFWSKALAETFGD